MKLTLRLVPLIALSLAGARRSDPASRSDEPSRCEVTGKPRWQCCPRKSAPMPPCCQRGCTTLNRKP